MLSKTNKQTQKKQAIMKLIITAWIKEQIRKHKYYTCSACGWTVLKAEAKISGFHDDRMYGRHVHCGNCGKIIATFV